MLAVSTEAARTPLIERSWWLRALAALAAPHAIFVQLRDESEDAVDERRETLFAILALASISVVLVISPARARADAEADGKSIFLAINAPAS